MDEERILASKELLEQVPELSQIRDVMDELLLVYMKDRNSSLEITGPAASVLVSSAPELEIKMNIADAYAVLENKDSISIDSIKMAHKKKLINIDGNYYIDAAKILDINVDSQTCILAVGLKNSAKSVL
jgi:hypothetical protein